MAFLFRQFIILDSIIDDEMPYIALAFIEFLELSNTDETMWCGYKILLHRANKKWHSKTVDRFIGKVKSFR